MARLVELAGIANGQQEEIRLQHKIYQGVLTLFLVPPRKKVADT